MVYQPRLPSSRILGTYQSSAGLVFGVVGSSSASFLWYSRLSQTAEWRPHLLSAMPRGMALSLAWASCSRESPVYHDPSGCHLILGVSFGMMLTTFVLKRYNNELQTSEVFSTAGRTVKSGLVSSAVVSSWTWAATLLQSSSVAYNYGVSGPFWYASGATVQVILFATLAIELKRKAPNAHTL